jgi:serine/arginine repetitive matrix protein 2
MLRVGVVESILTPETVSPRHRPNSYTGETSSSAAAAANNESHQQQDRPSSPSRTAAEPREARARTGLNVPVSEIARSSYMTTSTTASRMSGLSDFPVPPKDHHRMSLSAYFNEPLPPPPFTEQQQQHLSSSLGSDDDDRDDAGDLANTSSLSSS